MLAAAAALVPSLVPSSAHAWDTAEHVRYGATIAGPFEDRVLGARLPVIQPDGGPHTFGHWVSAPDFGRGILGFLRLDPVIGSLACATLWNADGVVDGEPFDDQSPGLVDQVAYMDCLDLWRMNNSHFGDFAAYHYAYYHRLATVAAERYRRTRQPACRAAAYTLEGWGQHYLTDSTAAGHGWNPAGTYDAGFDWQTTNSMTQRMRIHNHLNAEGARMAGATYGAGVMWGDHSSDHLPASVPEIEDNPQRALTLHVSRMSLAQVVMAGECGGPVVADDVLDGGDDDRDVRRVFVSDESMCGAMYGEELGTWVPDVVEDLGVDMPDVLAAAGRCRADGGALRTGKDEALLARHWFQDRYYQASPVDGWVSPTVDPMAVVDPADLGCADDMPVVAVPAGAIDPCGTAVCAVVPDDGACPDGMVVDGGCCFAPPTLAAAEANVTMTPWRSTRDLPPVELRSAGAITGESSEFLWFDALIEPFAGGAPTPVRSSAVATLLGNAALDGCGEEASFSVHETRVALAQATSMVDTRLELIVTGFDEGLRVEVDGRAVAYLARRDLDESSGTITVPLFGQAAPGAGGARVVRLVHLGDCEAARPLLVQLKVVGHDPAPVDDPGKPDDPGDPGDDPSGGDPAGGCGCRTSPVSGGGPGAALVLLALGIALRRRR